MKTIKIDKLWRWPMDKSSKELNQTYLCNMELVFKDYRLIPKNFKTFECVHGVALRLYCHRCENNWNKYEKIQ